jgi:hypothetical protein
MGVRERKYRMLAMTAAARASAAERAEAAAAAVEAWNFALQSRAVPPWSPTIGGAILGGHPWLEVYCPGCGTSRAIDIRTIDRHPEASVASLVIGLKCSWCRGGRAPMPRLLGLHRYPPACGTGQAGAAAPPEQGLAADVVRYCADYSRSG